MTLDKFNEIIDDALVEIAHGMIVNASGQRGDQLKKQLRDEFSFLDQLEAAARAVGAERYGPATA